MLFQVVHKYTTNKFSAGINDAIDNCFTQTRSNGKDSITQTMAAAFTLAERVASSQDEVKRAFAMTMVIYIAIIMAAVGQNLCTYASALTLSVLFVVYDVTVVRSIDQHVKQHAMKRGMELVLSGLERVMKKHESKLKRKVMGYLGNFESSDNDSKWMPYEWLLLTVKGGCLAAATNGSEFPWKVMRFVNGTGQFTDQFGKMVSAMIAPTKSRWGLGHNRSWFCSGDDVQMESIPEEDALSDRLLLSRAKRHFWNRTPVYRLWRAALVDNAARISASAVGIALLALAGVSIARRTGWKRAPKLINVTTHKTNPFNGVKEVSGTKNMRRGKTRNGSTYYAYEDAEGRQIYSLYHDDMDMYFRGERDEIEYELLRYEDDRFMRDSEEEIQYMGSARRNASKNVTGNGNMEAMVEEKVDGEPIEVLKSEPTLTKKAKKKARRKARELALKAEKVVEDLEKKVTGKRESSLGKSPVDTSKCVLAVLRRKDDHTSYLNAPIVAGKALVQKHLFDGHEFKVEDYEYVREGKTYPMLGPKVESEVEKEMWYFPAPIGMKSTVYKRGMVDGNVLVEEGQIVGLNPETGGIEVSSAQIYHKRTRHTGSTRAGKCGSLVLTVVGDTPKLVGFHCYGNDGTETNGYIAFTPALIQEVNKVAIPKN